MDGLLADTPKRKPWGATPIRSVVSCRKCDWTWKPDTGFGRERCPNCKTPRDVRHRTFKPNVPALKTWKSPADRGRDAERRYRRRAMMLVGRGTLACAECGCDDIRCLEINHKKGGGGKEHAEIRERGRSLHRLIAQMKRGVDDLELLCRPCNAIHFLKLRYGDLPFTVTWGSRQSPR